MLAAHIHCLSVYIATIHISGQMIFNPRRLTHSDSRNDGIKRYKGFTIK